jgi:phosphatidylinositol kinase/protein kinase (PI-3  family)
VKDRANKLSTVLLSKISEQLSQKREFEISVPGKYKTHNKLHFVESVMDVIGTQQHPRIVFMVAMNGKRYKYLLKGLEDLRNDERLMQFFSLANSIFRRTPATRDHNAVIIRYAVIPISPSAGLIAWVTGADTFHQMVCDYRKTDSIVERDIINDIVSCEFTELNKLQKYEIFEIVCETCRADELFQLMWIRAPSAAIWMSRNRRFTITTALMSMVGFLIGLGDRHPGNIMIQRETGNVVHIDFGESFESTLRRPVFPEKVQFRLTRMIANALEGSVVNGLFKSLCENVLSVLRMNRWSLEALLAVFVNEDQQEHLSTAVSTTIIQKLRGQSGSETLTVTKHVAALIEEASNPMNYVQHYPGWCPFW